MCDRGNKERGNFSAFTSQNKTQSSVCCLEGKVLETIKDLQLLLGRIPLTFKESWFLGNFKAQYTCPFSKSLFDIMRHGLRLPIIKFNYQRTCCRH